MTAPVAPRVVDCPTGETTHWILRSLKLPYESSSLCTAYGGNDYKVSVTVLIFVSPVVHDEVLISPPATRHPERSEGSWYMPVWGYM